MGIFATFTDVAMSKEIKFVVNYWIADNHPWTFIEKCEYYCTLYEEWKVYELINADERYYTFTYGVACFYHIDKMEVEILPDMC